MIFITVGQPNKESFKMAQNWRHYLDDDYEDEYKKVERIKHPKKTEEEIKGTKKTGKIHRPRETDE
jgi:hypothetical protein